MTIKTNFATFAWCLTAASLNFPVPSIKRFVHIDSLEGLDPSTIKPGLTHPMLDLFPKGTTVKIAVDGKNTKQWQN